MSAESLPGLGWIRKYKARDLLALDDTCILDWIDTTCQAAGQLIQAGYPDCLPAQLIATKLRVIQAARPDIITRYVREKGIGLPL